MILWVNEAGSPQAAFFSSDRGRTWRSVHPIQVWAEGCEHTKQDWKDYFGDQVMDNLPDPKDFDSTRMYFENPKEDPWTSGPFGGKR